jgi:hypothetical protein
MFSFCSLVCGFGLACFDCLVWNAISFLLCDPLVQTGRRKIRLIEGNAKWLHLKKLTFCFGVYMGSGHVINFVYVGMEEPGE